MTQSGDAYTATARGAASQWGLFTTRQARQSGATDPMLQSWLRRGLVDREAHGVYRVVGAPDDVRLDGLRVALLNAAPERWRHSADTGIAVSHLSAAHTVHGLGTRSPARDHLSSTTRRTTRARSVELHYAPDLTDEEISFVDGLPVTTIARTVVDLHRAGLDGGHLGDIIRDALRTGTRASDLAAALDPHTGAGGRAAIDEYLAMSSAPPGLADAADRFHSLA